MAQNRNTTENTRFKKHIINFSVFLIIALTIFFIASFLFKGYIFKNFSVDSAIILDNAEIISENRDFSYYIKNKTDDIKDTFIVDIKKNDIDKINEEYVTIFTPMMQCEAFELYINDNNIAIEGDIVSYNSNIWTQQYTYTIDSSLFNQEINQLKIVQYSRYMSGGIGFSFIIDGYHKSINLHNFGMISIHQAVYGISVLTLIILFLMLFLFSEKRKIYLITIVTLVFMMIGYIEFFKIDHLGIDFIIYKKIIVTANLLSVFMGTLFMRAVFNKTKKSLLMFGCYSLVVLIPTLIVSDMPTYKTIYTIFSFSIIPILVYWGYLSIKYYEKYSKSKIMIALTGSCIFYTIVWNIGEITQTAYMDSITVIVLPIFIVAALTLVLIDMHELRINVETSNKKYKKAYNKSIVDGLTNLYNAEYMKEIVESTKTPYAFVVFDIDDFKNINDTIGHTAGDEALRQISNITSEMLRDGDILSRYGGDEFILLLKLDSPQSLETILERLRKKVEVTSIKIDDRMLNITISIGYYLVNEKEEYIDMLKKADQALYQAKRLGKNRVISYHKPC